MRAERRTDERSDEVPDVARSRVALVALHARFADVAEHEVAREPDGDGCGAARDELHRGALPSDGRRGCSERGECPMSVTPRFAVRVSMKAPLRSEDRYCANAGRDGATMALATSKPATARCIRT
jgi:hypothetical protein